MAEAKPAELPAKPAPAPTVVSDEVIAARNAAKRRAAAYAGYASTIATSNSGLSTVPNTTANSGQKQLLGA